MTVEELIQHLQQFPPDAKVILLEEMGASELNENNVEMQTMNYNEYKPYWEHHSPTYGWELPSDYNRKTIHSEECVVIG